MTVLILGGAGYIGSHATAEFLARGYDVAVIDNLSTGHRVAVSDKARFYEGDIRDKAFLTDVFTKESDIESVVHCYACTLVGESTTKPPTLLDVMQDFDVKHIVFSSTAATFDLPEDMLIMENTPQKPINPYDKSKLIMEKMMAWQASALTHDVLVIQTPWWQIAARPRKCLAGDQLKA